MAKYLVTVATTVYVDVEIDATDRDDAYIKAKEARLNPLFAEGKIYEDPYIENIEELD